MAPGRPIIVGGNAGGYTTLSALAFRSVFKAGRSSYGIGDLETLARDTHKFESRYLDSLIGHWPQEKAVYHARSPCTIQTDWIVRSCSCKARKIRSSPPIRPKPWWRF